MNQCNNLIIMTNTVMEYNQTSTTKTIFLDATDNKNGSPNGNGNIREQASEYFLYQLAINVHKYWLITMAGLGIVGNLISLIVMRQVSEFSLIDM